MTFAGLETGFDNSEALVVELDRPTVETIVRIGTIGPFLLKAERSCSSYGPELRILDVDS